MTSRSKLSLAEADAILARAEELARSVLALGKQRSGISPPLRKRVGDRDGWNCRTCGESVDPALKWIQPNLAEIPEHEAYLASVDPAEEPQLLAWVGESAEKAEVVLAWSCGQTWKQWKTGVRIPSRFKFKNWSDGFRSALRQVIRQRALHNGEVATLEHLIPVSMGGTNAESNLAIAHKRCNTSSGASGATNLDLLDAPYIARRLYLDLSRLRDAQEVAPLLLAHYVAHLVAAWRLAGLLETGDDVGEAEVLRAATVYAEQFADLWEARRECIGRVSAFSLTFDGRDLAQYLAAEVRAADRKIKTLMRADAIERWRQRRLVAVALLPRAEANPSFLDDTLHAWTAVSGHAHDAAWWAARRDEFPQPPPGFTADLGLSTRKEKCFYCRRRQERLQNP